MTSCCNGCGYDLPSFPVSPIYTLLIYLMMSTYSSFYDDVLHTTAVQIRGQYFSHLKTVGRDDFFESWPSERGVNSTWKTKKQTCPWLIGSRLSQKYMARFVSCTKNFETRLWRHKSSVVTKHRYCRYVYSTVHCRQCRNTWYWLREGRVNWLLESLQLLVYRWKFLVNMSRCDSGRNKWEFWLTKDQVSCKKLCLGGWSYI